MLSLFDLHCDTLSRAYRNNLSLHSSNDLHISFNKCSVFSKYTQIMAIWTDDCLSDCEGFNQYLEIIKFAKNQEVIFTTNAEVVQDFSLFLSIEDLRIIENDLLRLDLLYKDGVRVITPVWKNTNVIGGAWNTSNGLSEFGKNAIRRMLELGIIPDLSHASEKTFYDILELCSKYNKIPIASHSNSYSVCKHKRNLTNEQISCLISLGSIVGISLAPEHLSSNGVADIEDILMHIDAYLSMGGESTVCLGCDFDGVSSLPLGISDISSLEGLYYRMTDEYGAKVTDKIFYANAHNFMKKNLTF